MEFLSVLTIKGVLIFSYAYPLQERSIKREDWQADTKGILKEIIELILTSHAYFSF